MTSPRSIARSAARHNGNHRGQHPRRLRNLRTLTGRVYLASSLQTYDTPRYDAMLERLRTLAPDAELLAARDLFASNADWRARWPLILPTLSALVFFCDDEGHIGYGTYTEVTHAHAANLPVWYLTDDGRTCRVRDASFGPMTDPFGNHDADVLIFPNATMTPGGCVTRSMRAWATVAVKVPAAEWLRTQTERERAS